MLPIGATREQDAWSGFGSSCRPWIGKAAGHFLCECYQQTMCSLTGFSAAPLRSDHELRRLYLNVLDLFFPHGSLTISCSCYTCFLTESLLSYVLWPFETISVLQNLHGNFIGLPWPQVLQVSCSKMCVSCSTYPPHRGPHHLQMYPP